MKLTTRQKELFEYIKAHGKVSQRDIFLNVKGYKWNTDPNIHDHCHGIWNDIARLNKDEEKPIIISKNHMYWIGDKEETKQYLKDLWLQLAPRLCRHWRLVKKGKRHGQLQLDFDSELTETFEAWLDKNDK